MGVSKETVSWKIWRCEIAKGLAETQRNEITGEQGSRHDGSKYHDRKIRVTRPTEVLQRNDTMTYSFKMDNFNGTMKDELGGARKTRVVFISLKI